MTSLRRRKAGAQATISTRRSYVSLSALREKIGVTQVAMADRLRVSQGEVSRLERRSNLRVSTLLRYIAALGGKLELHARFGQGRPYLLRLAQNRKRKK